MKDDTLFMAELFIKISAMERLLVKSGIIKTDELVEEMKKISKEVENILLKSNNTIS